MPFAKIEPVEGASGGDLRGPALEWAMFRWEDTSKDAGASSIFSRQGVWVAKPSWYVMFLLGLWWFFDFTFCTIGLPDMPDMFGQYGACHSPLMIPASLLAATGTMVAPVLLIIKYRGYAKPLLFIVILAGFLHILNALVILSTDYCSTAKGFRKADENRSSLTNLTEVEQWKVDRPCGGIMSVIPFAYGFCQVGAILFLIAPQYSFYQITGGLFFYNVGIVISQMIQGQSFTFAMIGPSAGFVVVGAFFKFKYEEAKRKAINLTQKDYEKYRNVWEATLKAERDGLLSLQKVWEENIGRLPRTKKRQPGAGKVIFFPGRKWVVKQDPSISALFEVADKVNPELQSKCQQWSETLPCCVSNHKGKIAKFHPGPVKKTDRALVKVFRSYDEDVGRLCDLCRCSLVFNCVADLATGLEMICADKDVEVQSCSPLKQRFAINYDDKISAGYRDVQLCIKVKTEKTAGMGYAAENHLCEVQMHLKAFYEKKGDGGHKNYKIARNLRGA